MGEDMVEFRINNVSLTVPERLLTPRISRKLQTGDYEADEVRAALMRLKPGAQVLELGAGLGFIAICCARVSGAKNVVAVEANPALLPVLRENLLRNGQSDVTLVHGAVTGGDAGDEPIRFDVSGGFWAGRIAETAADCPDKIAVPRLSLRALLTEHRPSLVVMDVEGAERELFDAPWPDHVGNVVIELHPKQYPTSTIKQIVDCLSGSGMTYDPGPSKGRVLSFRRVR